MKKSDKLAVLLTIIILIYMSGIIYIACFVEATWLGILIIIGGAGILGLFLKEL